jgi:hypothetical protein
MFSIFDAIGNDYAPVDDTCYYNEIGRKQKFSRLFPLNDRHDSILALSCFSTSIFKQQNQTLAQSYVQTIKYRNLVIDLGLR